MTGRHVTAEGGASLSPCRDGRLVPYAVLAFGSLIAALVGGQPGLAALSAPFLVALVLGLRRPEPVDVAARVTLDSGQVLEADRVAGLLELAWDDGLAAEVMLHRPTGVEPLSADGLRWSIPAGSRPVELPIDLRATRWGRHAVGEVWLRLEAPFGLLSWTGRIIPGPALRILPARERLSRVLDPPESRAVWGMHRSRRLGEGHEFAQMRPYTPGDRLRDLNWQATARYRRPFVNQRHPELSGDVLLAIDAVADGSASSAHVLAQAARIAWAVASAQMRANDRVGLLGMGGSTQWLPPAGGRLAKYRLLEALLRIGGDAAYGASSRDGKPRGIPRSTLVVVLTPLHDLRTLRTLSSWRASGHSVAVVMVDTSELIEGPHSASEVQARRVWRLELQRRRHEVTALGIPVVSAAAGDPAVSVVSALRRAWRGPPVRRR